MPESIWKYSGPILYGFKYAMYIDLKSSKIMTLSVFYVIFHVSTTKALLIAQAYLEVFIVGIKIWALRHICHRSY